MNNAIKILLQKHFYMAVIFCSLIYHQIFAKSPTPNFWEKLSMIIVFAIIVPLYVLSKSFAKNINIKKIKAGNVFILSLIFTLVMAAAQYFVLLIFFEKNPPISIGIPYLMYSFTQQKFLYLGLIYNYIFYLTTIVCLNYLRDKA